MSDEKIKWFTTPDKIAKIQALLFRIEDGDVILSRNTRWPYQETCKLANMVYRRFNTDLPSATSAWNRLMETNVTTRMFYRLIEDYELIAQIFNT